MTPPKILETYAFSLQIALLSGAQPHACFADAWNALIDFPQWFRHGAYVEGWIVLETKHEIFVVEHGWITLPDGRVVDPALVFLIGPGDPVVYFTGVEYTWQETHAFEGELLPRVWETHGSNGMEHGAYKAAHDAALEIATVLSNAYDPAKKMMMYTAQLEEDEIASDLKRGTSSTKKSNNESLFRFNHKGDFTWQS